MTQWDCGWFLFGSFDGENQKVDWELKKEKQRVRIFNEMYVFVLMFLGR